ncbi:MAG: hypothetical protein KDB22_18615 [Planctomycetales bacterium]|nr:hypothetical protein [Planctomycetales bacterium]MCA9199012.1 hypothetical protein [Planctomycetales bacterium]
MSINATRFKLLLFAKICIVTVTIGLQANSNVQAQTEIVFGQDEGLGPWTAANGRLTKYPESKAAYESFKQRCGNVDAVDFENLKDKYSLTQWGTTEERKYSYYHTLDKAARIELEFGDHETAVLSGMSQVIKVTSNNGSLAGAFPTSGEMAMLLISASGNADSTISFSQNQAAFGFYVTDIEANRLALKLIRDGQEDETITFDEMTVPAPNGGICFVGVINKSKPFKAVRLVNPGGGSEGFGFDDMVIAKPEQIQNAIAKMFVPGTFEQPVIAKSSYQFVKILPGWKTTDKEFEIWSSGFMGVEAYEGNQFVELNAHIDGTLYRESSEIVKGATIEFTFAHRGRNGDDSMKLTLTDLGPDNSIGGGDDTQLFVKQYTTGKNAWKVYDSSSEPKISALGNTVRFAYTAVDSIEGKGADKSEGNFLDAAHFGVNVVTNKQVFSTEVPHNGQLIASEKINFQLPQDPVIEATKQWGLLSKDETQANLVTVVRDMVLETIIMKDGKTYTRPTFDSISSVGEVGAPADPSAPMLIQVDPAADYKVVIDEVSWYDHADPVDVAPVQAPLYDARNPDGSEIEVPFAKEDGKYQADQFSNVEPVRLDERIRVRGKEYIRVSLHPVSFNPAKRTLRVGKLIKWHLEITPSNRPRPDSTRPFEPAREGILDVRPPASDAPAERPTSVETKNKNPGASAVPSTITGIAATAAEADYLIITPDRFVDEIKPLALWKHQKGFKTYVATLSQVGTTEAAIKSFIKNAFDEDSTTNFYVLLVGDHEELPAAKTGKHDYLKPGDKWGYETDQFFSDHLYSLMDDDEVPDIYIGRFSGDTKEEIKAMVTKTLSYDLKPPTGDWYRNALVAGQYQDRDGDKQECRVEAKLDFKHGTLQVTKGMLGKVTAINSNGDYLVDFDKLPKLVWSHKSKNELELKEPKLGFFESRQRGNKVSDRWFMETVNRIGDFLGPDFDFFDDEKQEDPFNMGYKIKTALKWDENEAGIKYKGEKYPGRLTAHSATPNPEGESTVPEKWRNLGKGGAAEITSAINDGVSIVFHRDHGSQQGWGDPEFHIDQVKKLANQDQLPFVFSLNCETGWFDSDDYFAEAWMRNANGGAVGFVGAVRVSQSGKNDLFCTGLLDTFWNNYSDFDKDVIARDNSWRPAEAMVRAKEFVSVGYPNDTLNNRLYNYHGDPELSLRTESPESLLISPPPSLAALEDANFSVAVTRKGSPCSGALVAFTMASGDHHVATTDASGIAKFSFAPSGSGKMKVVATERNSIPFVSEINVAQPGNSSGSSLLGKYENVPPTNDWHYVTIEQGTNGNFLWKNKAGVVWTIESRNGNELWFGKDCPYGEMKFEVKRDEAGNFTGLKIKDAFYRLIEGQAAAPQTVPSPIGVAKTTPPLAADQTKSIQTSTEKVRISITNKTGQPLEVHWVGFDGKEGPAGTIAAGVQNHGMGVSYPGHLFRFKINGKLIHSWVIHKDFAHLVVQP